MTVKEKNRGYKEMPKCGGGGVAESQPISTAVHRSPNKLWSSISIFNLWKRRRTRNKEEKLVSFIKKFSKSCTVTLFRNLNPSVNISKKAFLSSKSINVTRYTGKGNLTWGVGGGQKL
jgi:hypothetical protein